MNKPYLQTEPSMEDLLANIRRAITEDGAQHTSSAAPQPVIRGSMREMRVSFPEVALGANRADEIRGLRDRVSGQLSRREAERPGVPPPIQPRTSGFTSLLTGREPAPQPEPEPEILTEVYEEAEPASPELRGTTLEDDFVDARPASIPPWEEAPAVAAPRGYLPEFPSLRSDQRAPSPLLSGLKGRSDRPESHDAVMSSGASAAASASFNRLAEAVVQRAVGERSIEEVTREMLRGMLRQWLDENLPPLVERIVREEIERVARRGPVR